MANFNIDDILNEVKENEEFTEQEELEMLQDSFDYYYRETADIK